MVFFITVLRALAACLITNSHYTGGIYPTDLIANGGLLGDIIFFAVSGYCLSNVKREHLIIGFSKWYGKRIWRVYLPTVIATAIYMMLGFYQLSEHSFLWWYVYPTNYHFIASIILLYIPFYFIVRISVFNKRLPEVMGAIAGGYIVIYLFLYDKSYYHIDSVYEPMIRFLFMESMLLGAWFRQNDQRLRLENYDSLFWKVIPPVGAMLFMVVYFASKLLFANNILPSGLQLFNQVVIFVLLFFIILTFCRWDKKLEALPIWIRKCIIFISNFTLEIYVVQRRLIDVIRTWGLPFPVSWLCITVAILISAYILHLICKLFYHAMDKLMNRAAKQ